MLPQMIRTIIIMIMMITMILMLSMMIPINVKDYGQTMNTQITLQTYMERF